jgi:hypothetical protein
MLAGGGQLPLGEVAEGVDLEHPTTAWQVRAGVLVVLDGEATPPDPEVTAELSPDPVPAGDTNPTTQPEEAS